MYAQYNQEWRGQFYCYLVVVLLCTIVALGERAPRLAPLSWAGLAPLGEVPGGRARGPNGAARSSAAPPPQAPLVIVEPSTVARDDDLAASLRARVLELHEKSRGRRFRVCTQRGFLNVHSEPGDPYASWNVVGQLYEGEIVTGLEQDGDWLLHDGGGWSVRFYGDFEWLRPVDDEDAGPT